MTDHERYEVLCALAASGQLAGPEKAEFDGHCIQCPACRRQLQDLISVGSRLQLDAAVDAISAPMPEGALERFRARAIHEGIALRSTPARSSSLYGIAMAAAVLVIVTTLVFMPGRRKTPERLAMSAADPVPVRQSLPASVTGRKPTRRRSMVVHARPVRHGFVAHRDTGMDEAVLTRPQFPRVITVGYSFLGAKNEVKPLPDGYPALSRSQISHFALFPELEDSSTTNVAGIGTSNRSVDVASIGKVFDFARNTRPVYFQLPTAQ